MKELFDRKTLALLFIRWLDYLLSRMIYHTKAFIHNAAKGREEVRKKVALVAALMDQIDSEQQSVIKNLQDELDTQIGEIVRKLSVHLKSKDVQSRLTSWTDDDAPRKQDTWAATENDVEKAVKSRFRDEIEQWEIDNHVCSDARQSLVQQFSRQLNIVQAQIQSAENSIVSDSPVDQQPFEQPDLFTTGEKVLIAVTSPIWLPIGLVALTLSIPVLGVMAVKDKIEEKSKLRQYDKDKSGYLCQKSKDYLAVMTKGDNLRPYIKEQLEEVQLLLKQIKAKIPAIIVANRLLLAQLLIETCTKRQAEKFYRPINLESTIIRGNLAIFAIKEVRPVDINCAELEWKEDASSCLGRGGFATVYKGTMIRGGKEQAVALKVFNDVLNTSNARDFLTEDEILR